MNDIVYKKRKPMSEINVVPYIDVMLVLLIIFMVTAPLLQQGVDVELPKASAKSIPSDQLEPIVVSVDKAGNYFLNIGETPDKPIDVVALKKIVASVMRNKSQTPVLVKGDANVPYGKVVEAMTYLQQSGAPKVGLVTEPLPTKP